ncbi:DUF2752 domain-containing protein [uncultured Flavobacterium sp.]|uniref:DUF2752 domain-containing protein n=1 Tax=uncultured Flavobacterium sp. TaxID=165435 RepID=UPI0030CA2D82
MNIEEYMIPCMNKSIFGIECMGCGMQRSLLLLYNGKFVEAFKMFPALYTTLLFFGVVLLHFINKSRKYLKTIVLLAILNAVVLIIAYAYKMRFLYQLN